MDEAGNCLGRPGLRARKSPTYPAISSCGSGLFRGFAARSVGQSGAGGRGARVFGDLHSQSSAVMLSGVAVAKVPLCASQLCFFHASPPL